mgnify:CR=1 FL=1
MTDEGGFKVVKIQEDVDMEVALLASLIRAANKDIIRSPYTCAYWAHTTIKALVKIGEQM